MSPLFCRRYRSARTRNKISTWFKSPRTRLMLQSLEDRTVPALFTVTAAGNTGSGTLRDMIGQANTAGGSNTIRFDNTIFTSATTITLTSAIAITGQDLIISGSDVGGATSIAISGGATAYNALNSQLFTSLTPGKSVSFQDISLMNSFASAGGVIGALTTTSSVSFSNSLVSGNSASGKGGVLYAPSGFLGSVSITNSTFSGNKGTRGGAFYFFNRAVLSVSNSVFSGNTATSDLGGAIYGHASFAATISDSTFSNNVATTNGGAISANSSTGSSSVTITNCTFTNNKAVSQGGAIQSAAATTTVTKSTFSGNSSGGNGGAIYSTSTISLTTSIFSNNTATGSTGGGAVRVGSGNHTVSFSQFTNNTATGAGGALLTGGGTITVNNSTFSGNTSATTGGAISHGSTSSMTINESTFNKNTAAGAGGGALATTTTGALIVNNSTIYQNTASGSATTTGGGGILRTTTNSTTTFNLISTIVSNNVLTSGLKGIDLLSSANTISIAGTKNLIGTNDNSSVTFTTPASNQLGTNASKINALLSTLSDNGGEAAKVLPDGSYVKTMALRWNSPALNQGLANGFTNDQRGSGFARDDGSGVDVGAYEGVAIIPSAEVTNAPNVPAAGGGSYSFDVTYDDNSGFDTTTFDINDILVTGNGFGGGQKATSVSVAGSGKTYVVTYTIPAPTGGWGGVNIGNYSVAVVGSQVADDSTNFVPAGSIGTFRTGFATTIVVSQNSDVDDNNVGANQVSFREALRLSNTNSGFVDSITFDSTVFNSAMTTTLTAGARSISDSVVITGPTVSLTFDAANTNQQFTVAAGQSVTISNLKFSGFSAAAAGAVFSMSSGSISLTNTTFTNNVTSSTGGAVLGTSGAVSATIGSSTFTTNTATGSGGVMRFAPGAVTVAITGSTFTGNTASSTGGAIYASSTASVTISGSTFASNTAATQGGAIRANSTSSTVSINTSTFSNNRAGSSQGGAADLIGSVTISNSTFTGNSASTSGGALYVGSSTTTATISNSIFTNNTASSSSTGGGAIQVGSTSTVTISNSQFNTNTAVTSGGAIRNATSSTVTLTNDTFRGNTAGGSGGAVFNQSTIGLTINQSTFNRNTAAGTAGGGAIGHASTGLMTINNSTINNNTASGSSTAANGGGIVRTSSGAVTLVSTIVAGNKVTGTGTGGIDLHSTTTISLGATTKNNLIGNNDNSSVTFTDVTTNKLGTTASPINPLLSPLGDNGGEFLLPDGSHVFTMPLSKGSPALDAGDANGFTNDQRGTGFPRVVNGGISLTADIGAYEGISTLPTADLTSAPNVLAPGNSTYSFDVTYSDDSGFDTTTFGNNDVTVTGLGFGAGQKATSFSVAGGGSTYVVTYTIPAPTGGWGGPNVGTYSVTLNASEVSDDSTNFVGGGTLGNFKTAFATTLKVDVTTDIDDGNYGAGQLSFREAVKIANSNTGFTNSITFDSVTFGSATTITISNAAMSITQSVVITGPTVGVTFDAANANKQFNVSATSVTISKLNFTGFSGAAAGGVMSFTANSASISMTDVSFTNNKTSSTGGAALSFAGTSSTISITNGTFTGNTATSGGGGAIRFSGTGTLTMDSCTINSNTAASGLGGGIFLGSSTLTINNSKVTGNSASSHGGGIYASSTTSVTNINFTSVSNNVSGGRGGGWGNNTAGTPTVTVTSSLFSGNTATRGGGVYIFNGGVFSMTNSTVSGNRATDSTNGGGGVYLFANSAGSSFTIKNSTITNNTATTAPGGGLFTGGTSLTSITFSSNILAGNSANTTATSDINSTVTFTGDGNLVGIKGSATLTGSFNQNGDATTPLDAQLNPLANNGGQTFTHSLKVNSPALDAGVANGLTNDQRGLTRVVNLANIANTGDGTDIGAFEYQFIAPIGTLGAAPNVTVSGASTYSFDVVYTDDFGIDTTTIDTSDVTVSGPGFGSPQSPTGVVISGSGTSVTATYTIPAPGGTFDAPDNGTYTINLKSGQVADIDGPTTATAKSLGTFNVSIAGAAPPTVTSVVFGDGTNQRSLVKQIVVTFSESVNFMNNVVDAFTLSRSPSSVSPGPLGNVTLIASPVTGPASSVTITFSGALTEFGSLIDGFYDFQIDAAEVSGIGGALDGNNDTIPGGSYSVTGTTGNKFFRFFGDSDGSGSVDQAIDFVAFKNAFGFPSTVFDFNNSGTVDQAADFVKFKNNFGLTP